MTLPRVYKVEAVVLKDARLGETDRVLTLYTPYLGKLRAVAKGVAKSTSRMSGHLQPLTYTSLLIARGRNLDIITQAQIIEPFRPLREELWRTGAALYLAELLDRCTEVSEGDSPWREHGENRPIFELLLRLLRWLSTADGPDLPLRYGEIQLLEHLGYRPELHECVACREPLAARVNFFSPRQGGLLCARCTPSTELRANPSTELRSSGMESARPLSINAQKVLRLLQSDERATVARLRLDPALASELEMTLRQYLTFILERDLKSTAFLDLVRRRSAAAPPSPLPGTGDS